MKLSLLIHEVPLIFLGLKAKGRSRGGGMVTNGKLVFSTYILRVFALLTLVYTAEKKTEI